MITTFENRIARWKLEYITDDNALGFYRILFCFFFTLFESPSFAWIGSAPSAFYNPPVLSLTSLLNSFPGSGFFQVLDAIILLALIMICVGFLTRISTLVLFAALLAGNHFKYSFGKIDHDILVLCVLLVMAIVNWGKSLSIDQLILNRRPGRSSSLWMLAVLLTFGFFTAGFRKAIHWIDFDLGTNGFLAWLYSGYYSLGRQELLATTAIEVRPLWVWEFADVSAVIFELGFILAVINRRLFLFWLLVASCFHFGNCLILNIPFLSYTICYLAFVPWSRLIPGLATLQRLPIWIFIGLGFGVVLLGPPLGLAGFLTSPEWSLQLGAMCWLAVSVIIAVSLMRGEVNPVVRLRRESESVN